MSGPPVVKTAHFALHVLKKHLPSGAPDLFPGGGTWIGVLVPKRWAKCAVTRNTVRRQIYAVAQEKATSLPPLPLVVRLRTGFARRDFFSATSVVLKRAVRAELLQLLGESATRRWLSAVKVEVADAGT